jgi:predicted ATPase
MSRQFEFLKLLHRMQGAGNSQVILATHSPILMALPGARLLWLQKYGLQPVTLEDTDHYKMMREFILDPHGTVDMMFWT